jgi:hypothetical protein
MHLFPADRGVGVVKSIEEAVELVERGVRRVFEMSCQEAACHLIVQAAGAAPGDYTLVSVVAAATLDWTWDLLRAARGAAATTNPVAAIWVMPGATRDDGVRIYIERPDATEEARNALPEERPGYALGGFVVEGTGPIEPAAYVCLPGNLVEYGRRFAGVEEACFGPEAPDLRLAPQTMTTGVSRSDFHPTCDDAISAFVALTREAARRGRLPWRIALFAEDTAGWRTIVFEPGDFNDLDADIVWAANRAARILKASAAAFVNDGAEGAVVCVERARSRRLVEYQLGRGEHPPIVRSVDQAQELLPGGRRDVGLGWQDHDSLKMKLEMGRAPIGYDICEGESDE